MTPTGASCRAGVAAFAALIASCATPGGEGNERLALVIGNGAYENVTVLHAPPNDAADMCAALRRVGFRTLCHTNVRDRDEFAALAKDYVDQLGPKSVGVFYYSGHGVQAHNLNYLIPTQVQPETAREDPVRLLYGVDDFFELLRPPKSIKLQLVILDACRTDLFAPAPNTTAPSKLVSSLRAAGGVSSQPAPIQNAPRSTMVLYATESRSTAFDGGEARNSPLTKQVLAYVGARGLTLPEFISHVTEAVEKDTARNYGTRQSPFIYGSYSGTFCFAGCPGEVNVPPAF